MLFVLSSEKQVSPRSNCSCKELQSNYDKGHSRVVALEDEVLEKQQMLAKSEANLLSGFQKQFPTHHNLASASSNSGIMLRCMMVTLLWNQSEEAPGSVGTKPATESRKPMPKSHTRNHRILPSQSVNARRAADHTRKLNVVVEATDIIMLKPSETHWTDILRLSKGRTVADSIAEKLTRPIAYKFKTRLSSTVLNCIKNIKHTVFDNTVLEDLKALSWKTVRRFLLKSLSDHMYEHVGPKFSEWRIEEKITSNSRKSEIKMKLSNLVIQVSKIEFLQKHKCENDAMSLNVLVAVIMCYVVIDGDVIRSMAFYAFSDSLFHCVVMISMMLRLVFPPWRGVTLGINKIRDDDEVHNLRSVETKFLAIVFDDTFMSQAALSCEPTVFNFGGLTYLMAEGLSGRMLMEHRDAQGHSVFTSRAWRRLFEIQGMLLGGVRHRTSWRQFILALGLHTAEEMKSARFGAYWAESARKIPNKGGLSTYWVMISSAGDFLGIAPSYTSIMDPMLRLCHMLIACNIAGRSQAPKK
ncbi:hypothetical protein Tco_1570830, partial [Tanacetum coccineum]